MPHVFSLLFLTAPFFPTADHTAPPAASSASIANLPPAPSSPRGGILAATTDDWKLIDELPFTISAPGGYYLSGSLTGKAGADGINIGAADVVIDLNGFELVGVPGSLDAIHATQGTRRLRVRNGTIRAWGGDGVDFVPAERSAVEDVRAADNGGCGLRLGPEARVDVCVASRNGSVGVSVTFGALIERSISSENVSDGFVIGERGRIAGCYASANGEDGIQANVTVVTSCHAVDNAVHGVFALTSSQVESCTTFRNFGDGIRVGVGCTVRQNVSSANGLGAALGAGIRATGNHSRIEDNLVHLNDSGIEVSSSTNLIVRNTASQNGGGAQNFVIGSGNTFGPIVTGATIATSTNPHANYVP